MSRAVGLALGAVAGALAAEIVAPTTVIAIGLGIAALAIGTRVLSTSGGAGRRRDLLPVGAGLALIGLRALLTPAVSTPTLPAGDGPWTATVISVGAEHGPTRPAILRLDVPAGLVVAATLPSYPIVGADDRVDVTGPMEAPTADAYGAYLARVGAAGSIRATGLSLRPPPSGLGRALEELRRAAATALARAVPEPEAGLGAGILIGLRDRVDRQLAADFTTAGVSHVVAISGWNIAIVATSIGAIAGRLGRRRRTVLTGLAIVAYVAFVGPSPSVVRASAMAGLVLLSRELGRPSRATAALAWAVAGLLVLDPGYVDDAGFRLSVLATAGLMAWGTRLGTWLSGPRPGRVRAWFAESLGVSLAAQGATLPVILVSFGRLSLVAPVVNLAVVPLVAPAMAAGAVALVAGAIGGTPVPAIATVGGLPAWVLLGGIVTIVRAGASLPIASVTLEAPWDLVAAIVSAGLIAGLVLRGPRLVSWLRERRPLRPVARTTPAPTSERRIAPGRRPPRVTRRARVASAALAGAVLALGLAVADRPSGHVSVTVLDVGQGDGILVESGTGLRLLVDGGPDPSGLVRTLDERLPPWDHRIDILVLTHPHEDHVAGLALLLERYRVGRVFEPGMIGPGPGYAAWIAAFSGRSPPPRATLATGDRFSLGPIAFRVLWPDPGRVPLHPADGGTAINNVSIVLLGTWGSHSLLLAGDIEQGVDPEVLARRLPHVELLKVAHHGSRTASTEPFLEAVHPAIAVVSAGLGNPYGHPAPETIARLQAITKRTYRTDLDGSVTVSWEADTIRVRTTGPARRTAEAPAGATATQPGAPATQPGAPGPPTTAAALVAFACAIPTTPGRLGASDPAGSATPNDLPPIAALPNIEPAWMLAAARAGRLASPWARPRPPRPPSPGERLGYHRPDDRSGPSYVDRGRPERGRNGAPRLPVGRRRVRPRRGRGGLPHRPATVPRRRPGSLAPGVGGGRAGPEHLGDRRAPGDRVAVR
ncbi:MAG TPA: ComEC/Rec2 family competence protein [Candidatus Limnocylindrales bacterium]|nr:ComEC/Rec2 family competence protein [Candidatus Limnocylindrales bacterium]